MGNATLSQIELNNSINEGKAMKLNKKLLATAVACGAFALTSLANAADQDGGTITFEGNIEEVTCDLSVTSNGSTTAGGDATVTLADAFTIEFNNEGDISSLTDFSINLTACNAYSIVESAYLQLSGANIDSETGNLQNNGTARGIQLQLSDSNGVMDLSNQTNTESASFAGDRGDATEWNAAIEMSVSYVATADRMSADFEAGTVLSSIDYTVVYD